MNFSCLPLLCSLTYIRLGVLFGSFASNKTSKNNAHTDITFKVNRKEKIIEYYMHMYNIIIGALFWPSRESESGKKQNEKKNAETCNRHGGDIKLLYERKTINIENARKVVVLRDNVRSVYCILIHFKLGNRRTIFYRIK